MAAKGTIILLLRQWLVNFYEDGVRARPLKRRRSIRYTTQLDDLVAAELDELRFSPRRGDPVAVAVFRSVSHANL